jgi:amphi-Trp domain-containing protein
MGKNNEFRHESLQDAEALGDYLSSLEKGFRSGKLSFGIGDDSVSFTPDGLFRMDIKAKRNDKKNKLVIKISWKETGAFSEKERVSSVESDNSFDDDD